MSELEVGVKQNTISKFDNELDETIYKKIANCWRLHKYHCYHKKSPRYYCYGMLGWKFFDEWSPFNPDGLLNFYNWAKQYITSTSDLCLTLDKDELDNGLKIIRPESCHWISKSENIKERNLRRHNEQHEIIKIALAKNPYKKGVPINENMRRARTERFTCPYCGKTSNHGNYIRWHGNNCKMKP